MKAFSETDPEPTKLVATYDHNKILANHIEDI